MADKTRSGSSSRRGTGSSGRPPRGATPTPPEPDPIEETTIPAADSRPTEAAATSEAAETSGPGDTSPSPASATAPSVSPVPVAGVTTGTAVGTGGISIPTTISLTSIQLGDIIKAAVTQSMQQHQSFLASSKPAKKMVTDPYEGNIDVDDKQGLLMFNKATEALPTDKKLALSQSNGSLIHQLVKDYTRLYFWGIVLSKIPQDTTDPSSFKSLVIQPMLVSLISVMKDASRCWAKEDYSYDNNKSLPAQNIVATLDPNNPDDVALHYERTRRIMIAKK